MNGVVSRTTLCANRIAFITFSKRRKGEKSGGKGLRHFSMKVCEKVEKKGITTYNEVADELVSELSDLQSGLSDFVRVSFIYGALLCNAA